jgi:outer membrane murein-binding lipoprotein Lpp
MKKFFLIYVIAVIILSGCSPDNNGNNKNEEISNLDTQIARVQNQINQLQNDFNQLSNKFSESHQGYAIFTPSSKGYVTIQANVGYFVVSLDSLKKYANGYRAIFNIGNPNLITFNGIKVRVEWGEAYTKDKDTATWLNSLRSEEIEINKSLLPGVWNKIAVVLSPATANETGIITLSLTANNIFLTPDPRGSLSY